MPDNMLILAHDLGTTGNKATLFRSDGSIVATTFAGYPTAYPHPNWAEQNPTDWRKALFGCTQRLISKAGVLADDIAVVSFSGHMQGALVVDEKGIPLRPAIIWADQRATPQAGRIRERVGSLETYQLTGNRVSPAYTAAKLLWIKEHQPDIYARTHQVLQAKDYAAFLFSGVFATDYSDASLTQLLDLKARSWSEMLLEQLEIDECILPSLHPSATVVGEVTPAAAEASGLRPGLPVVIGGGDGACATVGAGSIAAGDVYNYIGSSSWVALTTPAPVLDPDQRTFSFLHLDPDLYAAIGTMQAAGGAFDWFERLMRDEAAVGPQYQRLDEEAGRVPPGSRGLLFLPYLLGERSPHWNPLARGAFVGLAMPHGKAEMTRAVLEGVAFNLRHILDIIRSQGVEVEVMRLIGGSGKSALWRQILADVYGLPIARLGLSAEATALGAAIAGGVGVGMYSDYDVAKDLAPVVGYDYPTPTASEQYNVYCELFKKTYDALAPIFEELSGLAE